MMKREGKRHVCVVVVVVSSAIKGDGGVTQTAETSAPAITDGKTASRPRKIRLFVSFTFRFFETFFLLPF